MERILKSSFEAIKAKWMREKTARRLIGLRAERTLGNIWQALVRNTVENKLMHTKDVMASRQHTFTLK